MSSFDDQRRARRDQARDDVRAQVQSAASGEDIDLDRLDQLLAVADVTIGQFSAAVAAVERQLKAEETCGTEETISAEIMASNERVREARVKLHEMTEEYRRQHGNPPPKWKMYPGPANMDGVPFPAGVPFIELERAIAREESLVYSLGRRGDLLTKATRLAEQALRFDLKSDAA